jgi:hypothetical protein
MMNQFVKIKKKKKEVIREERYSRAERRKRRPQRKKSGVRRVTWGSPRRGASSNCKLQNRKTNRQEN